MEKFDYLFKVLLIGDSASGKSSIMTRYTDNIFNKTFVTTIGVDFRVKCINYKDKIIKLQIWDTSGQEKFRTITSSYYRGAKGIFVILDLSDVNSLKNIEHWMQEIDRYANENVPVLLIGNKCDEDHKISNDIIDELVKKMNIEYIETSAKQNINIDKMFEKMMDKMIDESNLNMDNLVDNKDKIIIQTKKDTNENINKCC